VIDEGQKIPFDVSALRTIQLKYGDYRSLEGCKSELTKQIESLERNPDDVDSPVSQAIDVKALKGSNKPIEQGLAKLIEMVEALKGEIAAVRPAATQMKMPQVSYFSPSVADSIRYANATLSQPFALSNLVDPTFMTRTLAGTAGKPSAPEAPVKQESVNPTQKGRK